MHGVCLYAYEVQRLPKSFWEGGNRAVAVYESGDCNVIQRNDLYRQVAYFGKIVVTNAYTF